MKVNVVTFKDPKDRKGALHLCASAAETIKSCERRILNMQKHIEEVKKKIDNLENELKNLSKLMTEVKSIEKNSEDILEKYQIQFDLTQLEIEDLRIQLLKRGLVSAQQKLENSGVPLSEIKETLK